MGWERAKLTFCLVVGLRALQLTTGITSKATHGTLMAGKVVLRRDNLVNQIQDPAQQVNLGRLQDKHQMTKGVVCHDLTLLWGGVLAFRLILDNHWFLSLLQARGNCTTSHLRTQRMNPHQRLVDGAHDTTGHRLDGLFQKVGEIKANVAGLTLGRDCHAFGGQLGLRKE